MHPEAANKIVSVALITGSADLGPLISGMVEECDGFEWMPLALDWRSGVAAIARKPLRLLLADWDALGDAPLETLCEIDAVVPPLPLLILQRAPAFGFAPVVETATPNAFASATPYSMMARGPSGLRSSAEAPVIVGTLSRT